MIRGQGRNGIKQKNINDPGSYLGYNLVFQQEGL